MYILYRTHGELSLLSEWVIVV